MCNTVDSPMPVYTYQISIIQHTYSFSAFAIIGIRYGAVKLVSNLPFEFHKSGKITHARLGRLSCLNEINKRHLARQNGICTLIPVIQNLSVLPGPCQLSVFHFALYFVGLIYDSHKLCGVKARFDLVYSFMGNGKRGFMNSFVIRMYIITYFVSGIKKGGFQVVESFHHTIFTVVCKYKYQILNQNYSSLLLHFGTKIIITLVLYQLLNPTPL